MPASPTTRHRGPTEAERGATLLEAALVLPLCMLLFFGMIAAGSMMKTYSSTANAVRAAGRMASVAGADPLSDRMVLSRAALEAGGVRPASIDLLVIWHATGPGAKVPAGCLPAVHTSPNVVSIGVSDGGNDALGACNVYVHPADPGGAFDMAEGRLAQPASYYFGCQGSSDPLATHKVDCRWPGKDRRAVTSPRTAAGAPVPPDFVGIYMRVEHHLGESLFGARTISDTSVTLIEPHGYSS